MQQIEIKCLSMFQPWASLLTLGIKKVETRGFKIWKGHRGTLRIHSSKIRKKDYTQYYIKDEDFRAYVNQAYEILHGQKPRIYSVVDEKDPYGYEMPWKIYKTAFPLGSIIGHAEVSDCMESFDLKKKYEKMNRLDDWEREWTLGDLSSDRWAWPVINPCNYATPIQNVKGQLGLWNCAPYIMH
jgi:hypothetical protein